MVSSEDHGLDEVILQVFEEHEESFHFPVATQKEARAFVKALHGKLLSYDSLLHEIKELEQNFSAWRKGISRPGIGNRVIERINRPLQEILHSDGEEEDPDYLDQLSTDSDEVESNHNGVEIKNNGENRLTADSKSNVEKTENGAESQKQHDVVVSCSGNTSATGAVKNDCKSLGNLSVDAYDKAVDVTKNLSAKTEEGQDKVKDGEIRKDVSLEKTKQDSSIAENKTIVDASGKSLEITEKKQEAVAECQKTVTEKKQETVTEKKLETAAEKKQEAITEKKQEAVTEKKQGAVTDKKLETATEKKQEATEKKQEATEKKQEAVTEKKQEAVSEKKLEAVTEKKLETAAEKKQEAVTEKKLEAVTEKKLETAAEKKQEAVTEKKQEAVTDKKLETTTEKKQEATEKKQEATEKKQEAVTEKKQEAVTEKKQEAIAEKKLETATEKKEEATEKKQEATEKKQEATEKKQEAVTEKKLEAVTDKKLETATEKKQEATEKKQESVSEKKQATPENKLESVAEKKQNVVSGNKQAAGAEERQITALTDDQKTAQPVIVKNKEVDLLGGIVPALQDVQDQRANKERPVESSEGDKSGCPKKEIAGIAAQCKSESPSELVKHDEATLKYVDNVINASQKQLEDEAASVSKSNELVAQNRNSEIESKVVEHKSVSVHAAEPVDQTNLPEKENASASTSIASSGADAENQKIKLDQLQCHPNTSDEKCQGNLNDILESYNSDFDDELHHGAKCGVTTKSDDTSMTCGKPQATNESQEVGEGGAGYVYVFTDSSAENVAYRVKVGASRFPHKKLQQALLFNIDMKLVSAVQVSDQRKALDAVHQQLNRFSIPKTVGWFCGPLESILNVLMAVAKDYPHQD